jgi:oligoribonuclease NrnB/cAMP/cGMP phosphodiesterase (DHH superfamily)
MFRLLSHTDLDGVGCGILAKLAFGKRVKVRYNSISGLNHEVERFLESGEKNTMLLITDLSVNEENEKHLDRFYQKGGKVQLIDHHQTALHFNEYEWGHVVVEDKSGNLTSATSLFYEYLIKLEYLAPSNALREFVELVRQYDTWEWEKNDNQEALRLNSLFFLVSIDEFEEMMMNRLMTTSDRFFFNEFEERILDMEENKIERYIRRKRRELVQTRTGDYYAGVVYAESNTSELGNELGKEYPHLDYIAIINIGGKRMGFRTIHDHVDVSQIAGQFGGGGHVKASGCRLTDEAYQQYVIETFHLEPLREDAKRNKHNIKKSSFGTLYENRMEETFFLYPVNENEWAVDYNEEKMEETFDTFEKGECFLKRNFEVWLARDEVFVTFLIDCIKKQKR